MLRRATAITALLLAALAIVVLLAPLTDHGERPRPLARVHVGHAAPVVASRFGISQDFLVVAGTPAAREFASRVLGPHGRIRIFIPYDARGAFNGHGCARSPAYSAGAVAWDRAITELAEAKADGLQPQLVFGQGTGIGGVPAEPDPAFEAQAADYACGLRLALSGLWLQRRTLGMPVDIEAWNEPENDGYAYNWDQVQRPCAEPALPPSCSGPWEAAMLWYEADTAARSLRLTLPRFPALSVGALTMAAPQESYFLDAGEPTLAGPGGAPNDGYYQSLYRIIHCVPGYGGCGQPADEPTAMPAAWAVHDYLDPTAQGAADLTEFVRTLAQLNDRYAAGAGAQVWITESGVRLDMPVRHDLNHPHGVSCPAAAGVAPDTFGCLVDGAPAAQARGARAWRRLVDVRASSAHGRVSVTQLFWYELELPAETCTRRMPCQLGDGLTQRVGSLPVLHTWDSALVDSTGAPRASFCALTGEPISDCRGRADAYADAQWANWWQSKPARCPIHFGAWVAESADSGVPSGEQCDYSPIPEPSTAVSTRRSAGIAAHL